MTDANETGLFIVCLLQTYIEFIEEARLKDFLKTYILMQHVTRLIHTNWSACFRYSLFP